jgi:membrane-associated protein
VEFINEAVLHAAGQWWIYPLLLVFFFVDGFAMVVPSETLIVALAAFSRHSGEPNLWILGFTALVGAIAGDNMAFMLGRRIGLKRWKWMRRPKVQKAFSWARYELDKRGAVLIFTARYIPWGRVAVNLLASSFPWLHHNPLLSAGIAVVFAIVLGVLLDHVLRLWHKHLARNDAQEVDGWLDGGPSGARGPRNGSAQHYASAAGDGEPAAK